MEWLEMSENAEEIFENNNFQPENNELKEKILELLDDEAVFQILIYRFSTFLIAGSNRSYVSK